MTARVALVGLACLTLGVASAGASTRAFDRSLSAALATPGVDASTSTAIVLQIPSGRVVYARNPALPLEPASNEKLGVTYTALVEFGPHYRFPTEILGEGRRAGNVWRGNIVLKGFGDPSLTSADLERAVGVLWREGVRKVTGKVVGDASFFDGKQTAPGWLPSFAGLESPPLSALVVDRADVDDRLATDPPLAAAIDLKRLLAARGIPAGAATTGRSTPGAAVLVTIYSERLTEILEFMDHNSDNFTAEMLLKAIGAQKSGYGTTADGAAVVRQVLGGAGVPLAGVRIVDGSGLSRWDRVTGQEISALLLAIWRNPTIRAVVLGALPVAGESGTLAYRMTTPPALGMVRAKTGTTDIASALSGYVGDRYIFVTIDNGNPVNTYAAHSLQDAFAETLAARVASA